MKASEYKAFKALVGRSDEHSDIWYAGYYWMALNGAQCRDIMDLLETLPFIKAITNITGRPALLMPSGLCIEYKGRR